MTSYEEHEINKDDDPNKNHYLSVDDEIKPASNVSSQAKSLPGVASHKGLFNFATLKDEHWIFDFNTKTKESSALSIEHTCAVDQNITAASCTGKNATEKRLHFSNSSTSSNSSKSITSPLPDLVSITSSSSEPNFSLIEDISNRNESSLNGSRCPSMNTMAEEEEVFENSSFSVNVDYVENERTSIIREKESKNMYSQKQTYHREFSTPGTVSDEKKQSLQEAARSVNFTRSVSYHLGEQTDKSNSEYPENYAYIISKEGEKKRQYFKSKSCSDLGSSLSSSKDDGSVDLDIRRRSNVTSSTGYGTGGDSFDDNNEFGDLQNDDKQLSHINEVSEKKGYDSYKDSGMENSKNETEVKPENSVVNSSSSFELDLQDLPSIIPSHNEHSIDDNTDSETEVKPDNLQFWKERFVNEILGTSSTYISAGISRSSSVELDHAVLTNLPSIDGDTEVLNLKAILEQVREPHKVEKTSEVHDLIALKCLPELPAPHTELPNLSYIMVDQNSSDDEGTCVYHFDSYLETSTIHDQFCQAQLDNCASNYASTSYSSTSDGYHSRNDLTQEAVQSQLKIYRSSMLYERVTKDLQENHLPNGKSLQEILKYMVEDFSDSDSDLETDSDMNEELDNLEQPVPSRIEFSLGPEEEDIVNQLAMAKRCDRDDCEDGDCQIGKKMYEVVGGRYIEEYEGYRFKILAAIFKHSGSCEEACSVPYCHFFYENCEVAGGQNIADMITLYNKEFCSNYVQLNIDIGEDEFISLDQGYSSMPVQGVNYEVLTRIGENVFFGHFTRMEGSKNNLEYIAIKKAQWDDTAGSTFKALKETQSVLCFQNQHLVSHLWACKSNSRKHMYVTTQFEGNKNLRENLLTYHPDGMPAKELINHIQSLYSALLFLHEREILYLHWLAGHVIYLGSSVKLCNFNLAVTKDYIQSEDIDDLSDDLIEKLPPYIIPPEFHEGRILFPESDYWGFGCLIYELATGNHVHWDKRHLSIQNQRDQIQGTPFSDFTDLENAYNPIKGILQQCFMLDVEQRTCNI